MAEEHCVLLQTKQWGLVTCQQRMENVERGLLNAKTNQERQRLIVPRSSRCPREMSCSVPDRSTNKSFSIDLHRKLHTASWLLKRT